MCAAGVATPSLMSAGTRSETMTMYAGVVGMPMPSTMPAIAVRTSARMRLFWASARTICVKVMPSPVSEITPITMPAQAQAMATESASRAPPSSASTTVRQVIPSRVLRRMRATGSVAMVPTRAQSGAL